MSGANEDEPVSPSDRQLNRGKRMERELGRGGEESVIVSTYE